MAIVAWFKKVQLWLYSYLFAGFLAIVVSFYMRRRMSHNNGLAATGRIRVVDHPTFPPHDFFSPGREFRCRIRHASVSYPDDTIIQVRAASLKFADTPSTSPLDLQLNTGQMSLFWTARNFLQFARDHRQTKGTAFAQYYQVHPRGLLAAWDGIRKNPSSFAQLYYHSQTAQFFIGKDGVRRYAKFRLIPADGGPETGLVDPAEFGGQLWPEVRLPGETRSVNYLKEEFARRLGQGPVRYVLQVQLHTPHQGDPEDLLNCNVAWDPSTHPFHDVAAIDVEKVLSWDESNQMIFSISNHPPSLGLIPAASLDDYNSVSYMRARSDLAARVRLLVYRILGVPKLPADHSASTASLAQVEPSQVAS